MTTRDAQSTTLALTLTSRAYHFSWIVFVSCAIVSFVYSWIHLPFVIDDALISFRYSDRLLHGGGLTWNDGEFVEGYSNLLWVLLISAGGLIHHNLIFVGWTLGLISNATVLLAVVWAFRPQLADSIVGVTAGLAVLALSQSFAIWGIAGLETAFFNALLAWSLATTYRRPHGTWIYIFPALPLGLLSITRPDGILFSIGLVIAVVLRDGLNRDSVSCALRFSIAPISFLSAQLIFRLFYYGSYFPNTAYVKVALTGRRLWIGVLYVAQGAVVNFIPLSIVLVFIFLSWRSRERQVLRQSAIFIVPATIWLAYITLIGGDIMPENRHWLPALVCLTFALCAIAVSGALTAPTVPPRRLTIIWLGAAALYIGIQTLAEMESPRTHQTLLSGMPRVSTFTRDVWNCIAIGELLHRAFSVEQPLLAVNSAGCMPYASGLPSIDMLGLTNAYIAHHRPSDIGEGTLGHELGDGVYVLSRKPDLIQTCGLTGRDTDSCGLSLQQMGHIWEFQRDYRIVFFRARDFVEPLWVRVQDGRLGIVSTARSIYIPGFLLATTTGARAVLSETGRPATALESGEAVVDNVHVPAGTWEVSLETDTPNKMKLVTHPAASQRSIKRPDSFLIVSDGSTQSFHVLGSPGLVYGIKANRLNE